MTEHSPKKINAKQVTEDLRHGLTDAELMKKYGLTEKGLASLYQKLKTAGITAPKDPVKPAAGGKTVFTWKCPQCGVPQTHKYDECPQCGVIISKIRNGEDPAICRSQVPGPEKSGEMEFGQEENNEVTSDDLFTRSLDGSCLRTVGIGLAIAIVIQAFCLPKWIFDVFKTLVHEMGHAIFGWIFAYPSLPAFDVIWGGGVTVHMERSNVLLVVIYCGLAGLIYVYRKNPRTVMLLAVVAAIHVAAVLTKFHSLIIVFMGHGTELLIAALFIYRALSGSAVVHPAERPLYAALGFFIVISDLVMSYQLLTNYAMRSEYLSAKGDDCEMDFIRISRDHLNVKFSTVVGFFFICTILTPVLGYLGFRYERYVHYAIAKLWQREAA